MPYLVQPFDVLYFRGNKSFDFGEWYSEGIFPPYPSTFQGFVRTLILNQNNHFDNCGNLVNPTKAEELVGNDNLLPWEITGPFLFNDDQFYLPTPFDIHIPQNQNTEGVQIKLSDEMKLTDLGVKLYSAWFANKASYLNWTNKYCNLEVLNQYRKNGKISLSTNEKKIIFKEQHIGIKLKYRNADQKIKKAEESLYYMTHYTRFDKDTRFYFQIEYDLNERFGKLGSEGRAAKIENCTNQLDFAMDDDFYDQIIEDNKFKLILIQPGIFKSGWLPFTDIQTGNGFQHVNYLDRMLKLLYARTEGICKISGMSLKKQQNGQGDKYDVGLKPMLNAVPAGAVYYFEIEESVNPQELKNLLKSLDGRKIENKPYSDMGFNQVVIGRVF